MKKLFAAFAMAVGVGLPPLAIADDWGCEVLMCLANPNGPTAVNECKPPIHKLWKQLAKGKGFPSCAFKDAQGNDSSNDGNHASHQWASPQNCAPGYVVWDNGDGGQPYCRLRGGITVTIDHQKTKKVWWGLNGHAYESDQSMVEETYTNGSNVSDQQIAYDAWLNQQQQQQWQNDGG